MDPENTISSESLALADRIAGIAKEMGIDSAVIGAVALAAHGYPRMTADIDLATDTDPFELLTQLKKRLITDGFECELNTPDGDDPLGGVLTIEAKGTLPIQLVNYFNPLRGGSNPGGESIATAIPAPGLAHLRIVDFPHLIALKLYAGGNKSRADAIELLRRSSNPSQTNLHEVCARFDLSDELDRIVKAAAEPE